MKQCAHGTLALRMFAIGAAKKCSEGSAAEKDVSEKRQCRPTTEIRKDAPWKCSILCALDFFLRQLARDEFLQALRKNLTLVPNWELKSRSCTEMVQRLAKQEPIGTGTLREPASSSTEIETKRRIF